MVYSCILIPVLVSQPKYAIAQQEKVDSCNLIPAVVSQPKDAMASRRWFIIVY